MAAYGWRETASLAEWLFNEAPQFDFYQAIKILELMSPEKKSVGEGLATREEPIHFKSAVLDSFPASSVTEVYEAARTDQPHEMHVAALSLAGQFGPLPGAYTDLLLTRIRQGDLAMAEFLDIFNHRLISLLYRHKKKTRLSLNTCSPDQSQYGHYLYSLLGMSTGQLQDRMALPDRSLLWYAGLIAAKPTSKVALENILASYFQVKVHIKEFVGRWLSLEAEQITAIGSAADIKNNVLGENVVLGKQFWDQQGKIAITMGPLSYRKILTLLPNKKGQQILGDWIRFTLGTDIEYDLKLKINPFDIPLAYVNSRNIHPLSYRSRPLILGRTSWLKSRVGSITDTSRSSIQLHSYVLRIGRVSLGD